ncbi:hypothetical protein BB561_003851 [Smittium simulii]|uniref:GH16 domain-containing protein n=1 Tax=Smittium simulii TaxID=133385 RepID=A0A2T9YJ86_9FUNG|nr:hypothetical protein BB561_003851 [Smittium simulii]
MIQNSFLYLLLLFALATNYVEAACEKYGDGKSNCPKSSPCCYQGYCDSSAVFCILGNCRPGDSFSPESCWPKPHCSNIDSKFTDPSVLVNKRKFTGDVAKQIWWVDHGTFTADIKSGCTQPGVVSSFIVRNEFGDEIDFEWVGLDKTNVQTNYYYNDELDYTKMLASKPLGDSTDKFISYTIDWQPDSVSWYADNKLIRTVQRADTWSVAEGIYKFPDREAQLSFSIWDGGNTGAKGTMDWAGSPTPYDSDTVYSMYVKNIKIKCLYNGNDTYTHKNRGTSSSESPSSIKTPSSGSSSEKTTQTGSSNDDSSDSNNINIPTANNLEMATTSAGFKHGFASSLLVLIAVYFF